MTDSLAETSVRVAATRSRAEVKSAVRDARSDAGRVSNSKTELGSFQHRAKRGLDIVLSLCGLVVLLPLLVLVGLSIKLDSRGPIFFRQAREGLDGKLFFIFKFRSMSTEAGDSSGVAQTVSGDSRVTRVGRFLRKNSIDELPQLINVLLGEMSLVGPRPHVPGMLAGGMRYDELCASYHARHAMRPGITGLAQANGLRGSTTDAAVAIARVEHDLAYIQNFNLLLDLKILLQTLRREFIGAAAD